MDKATVLEEIFGNDPFGLLTIKPTNSPAKNSDERLLASFQEILSFYESNHREPAQGGGLHEHQLYSRLNAIRSNPTKMEMLKTYDRFDLLDYQLKEINSIDDILNDDPLGLLDDDSEGLFDFKHIKRQDERASTDFVAKRKPCKDFEKYEADFRTVQQNLASGKRKLTRFNQENLRAGDFYVHNGILLLLESVDFEEEVQQYKSGSRLRKDGRTSVIFENGTESNMLYRSLYKSLLANGKAVTENTDQVNESFVENFNSVSEEDLEAGFIYILKSKSEKAEIKSIEHLYKIGFSKTSVEERIKTASKEPTFLMADVRIVTAYKCYNLRTHKLEQLLHIFFGSACLNFDIYDSEGIRHTPREWFIAPVDVIEQAVELIKSGDIISYRYDVESGEIVYR